MSVFGGFAVSGVSACLGTAATALSMKALYVAGRVAKTYDFTLNVACEDSRFVAELDMPTHKVKLRQGIFSMLGSNGVRKREQHCCIDLC
ncbi:hypothetical protein [Massilia rhizosphaerae]|uniref:hypothetical protein n=1 Tax=Massilia rhizosphaerae TaxID=2784389 RepID=UPI0018DBAE84|nr:hypothetical protein [Massilia rhizosphaerae]